MRLAFFGAHPSRRRLVVGVACSLCLHLSLVALALWAKSWAPRVVVKKGEPLFIELPPAEPEEPAPPGTPTRPPGPVIAAKPRPPAARANPPKARPAPEVSVRRPPALERARPSPPPPESPRTPEPAPAAKAAPLPEPEGAKPAPSDQPRREPAPPAPEGAEPKEGEESRLALARPKSEGAPGLPGGRGSSLPGGGLRRGRGGIEGEPIPLDTTDPRYTDYFERVRRQIKANWIYPREAGERGIGGLLVIDFAIAKSGHLEAIELRRSSGVDVLDLYALNAVKLAQPFPPVPDSVSKGVLPIKGIFTYQIVDTGLLNQFLR